MKLIVQLPFVVCSLVTICVDGETTSIPRQNNVAAARRTEQSASFCKVLQCIAKAVQYEMVRETDKNTVFKFQIGDKYMYNLTFCCTKVFPLNLRKALRYHHRAIMTPCKAFCLLNNRVKNKYTKYLFLETFIFMSLFCSDFTQGKSDFVSAQKTISIPYRLFISFCDRDFECVFNISRQNFIDNICLNIKCSNIRWNRTINCEEKLTISINENLGLELRCNVSENRSIEKIADRQQTKLFDGNILKSFHVQRRLLSKSKTPDVKETTKFVPKDVNRVTRPQGEVESDGLTQTTKEPFNYTKFMEVVDYVNRKRSKDPVWAMFSILALMGILVWAIWCCGMKKIQTNKLINVTIDEHFHFVSMRDILKSKKKYLSKKILQFKRRHMHRKHKYRRLKDIEKFEQDVVSDNSEDERLIYANDF